MSEPTPSGQLQAVMYRLFSALLIAAGSASLPAQTAEPDPMNSRSCVLAREALEQAIGEPAANREVHAARLARARQQAATACLGRDSSSRERSGAPQPPQIVAPAPAAVPQPRQLPAPAAPAAPLAIPRAATITACDPAGCWDSEGRRLNNVGPLLVGPRGLCTLQGGVLNCP